VIGKCETTHPRISDRFTIPAYNPLAVTGSLTRPLMRVDPQIGFSWNDAAHSLSRVSRTVASNWLTLIGLL